MARTREEVRQEYLKGAQERMQAAIAKGAVVGYAPGVPGARTAAERRQAAQFGEPVSAYTGKASDYRGGSHKVGGVELVPGAPGYNAEKALPILQTMVAPYSKDVQSYLKDIGKYTPETAAAVEKVQKEDEYRKSLAQMAASGEITGPRAEAHMIDYARGQINPDIEQRREVAVEAVKKQEAEAEQAAAKEREKKRLAYYARQKARPMLQDQTLTQPLAPSLQMT